MKYFKFLMMGVALAGTPLMLTACEEKSALEEAAEEVEDEIDDATTGDNALEEGFEEMVDEIKDATDNN